MRNYRLPSVSQRISGDSGSIVGNSETGFGEIAALTTVNNIHFPEADLWPALVLPGSTSGCLSLVQSVGLPLQIRG